MKPCLAKLYRKYALQCIASLQVGHVKCLDLGCVACSRNPFKIGRRRISVDIRTMCHGWLEVGWGFKVCCYQQIFGGSPYFSCCVGSYRLVRVCVRVTMIPVWQARASVQKQTIHSNIHIHITISTYIHGQGDGDCYGYCDCAIWLYGDCHGYGYGYGYGWMWMWIRLWLWLGLWLYVWPWLWR